MSQQNVEIVKASYDAWNAGDMDAYRELYDPDAVVRPPEGWPEPGPFFGREAATRWFEQLREAWDADAAKPINGFIDAADRVVVRWIWHGAGQGPEASMEMTAVFTVRKGRILGLEFFWDHAEALETLGLREQTMSENVELVHRAVDAFNRRDLDAYLALMDRDVEAVPRMAQVEGGYHGHDGIRRWWEDLFDVLPDFTVQIVEAQDLGDLTVAALRTRAHGVGSDISTEDTVWQAARWRRGKTLWWGSFDSRAEALEAVGLSESPTD